MTTDLAATDLTWAPAWRLRAMIADKQVSAVEVTDHFLARIERFNPTLKAFRHIDAAGARAQAQAADTAVARGEALGPLHGVPISFKPQIAVAGMPMKRSIGGGPERVAEFDDLCVTRLRAAGAIVVGMNTMMGVGSPTPGQFNWDAEARNPWNIDHAPGWSSGGSAATAAAALLPLTIGADGGGSTRLPGAYCGVVGVHPSTGLVPSFNYAVVARRNGTVSVGPLARDVRDAAIALQAMSGPDGRDFDCIQAEAPDMLSRLDAGAAGMRLAWTDDYGFTGAFMFPESAAVIDALREAALGVRALGASLDTTNETWEEFWPSFLITNYLFLGGSAAGRQEKPDGARWAMAMDARQRNWKKFHDLFQTYDLLLSPTSQVLAPTMEDWSAYWTGKPSAVALKGGFAPYYTSHTQMFNWLGLPGLSIPAGFVNGLPIGLQIVGWPGREDKMFRLAQAFMKAYPRPEKPQVS